MGTFKTNGKDDPLYGAMDIGDGLIITCFGKKKSGKSVMGRMIFDSYPGDRVVIAVNADDGPFPDPERGIHLLKGTVDTLPARWPEHLRETKDAPLTLRFELDPGSATFLEDQDHVVGLCMTRGDVAMLVHEVQLLATSNRVPPHMKRFLIANRHAGGRSRRGVTGILCGPRPITVDPLVIGQADVVYVFDLPVKADRERIAETIGWDIPDFTEQVQHLRTHEYLRYDANQERPDEEGGDDDYRLIRFAPLPPEAIKDLP